MVGFYNVDYFILNAEDNDFLIETLMRRLNSFVGLN